MKKTVFAKAFAALLALITVSMSLSGCHGKRKTISFVIPESFDTEKEYNITFWAKNDTNKTQTAIYEKAIRDFEALYPNITVNMRLYTDYGKIYNDVITNIATGTTPDVCITYPDHIATYLTGENTVVALDELMQDEKYGLGGSELRFDSPSKEEIIPQFLAECKLGESYFALPFMRSTEVCYVNKDYVEALGYTLPEVLTWDFVFEVSEKATEKDADGNYILNGQKVMIPFIYKSTDNMMIQMLFQKGADYLGDDGEIGIFGDTTREILYTVAEHAESGAFSTFKISSYPANFLNAGQCVFAVDSTAGATWMGTDAPLSDISEDKIVEFETAVMAVPQFDTENMKMISQGPSVCVFNNQDPGRVLASWIFAQYLLTNDVQIAYSETEGYVPVTSKARGTAEYTDYLSRSGEDNQTHYKVKIDAARLLLEHSEDTFITPVMNGSASLRDASGMLIENVAKAARRKVTVDDEYLDGMFDEVFSLYRLDSIGEVPGTEKNVSGPLPAESAALLVGLGTAWVFIILFFILGAVREKKR